MSMSVSDYAAMSGAGGMNAVAGGGESRSMNATLNNIYARMDQQGTDAVSRDRFRASMDLAKAPSPVKLTTNELFDKLDPAGTGTLSREEFVAGMKKLIADNRPKQAGAPVGGESPGGSAQSASARAATSPAAGVNRPTPDFPTGTRLNLYA